MDYNTKSAIQTGIVDRNRYANDPIYRDTLNRYNPVATPTRLKQFPPEYYAQNRAAAAQGLWELIKRATAVVFVSLALVALSFTLAAMSQAELPMHAPDLTTASYIGLGVAGVAGLAYAAAARRAEKVGIFGLIGKTAQGAALAACVIMVPMFVFVSYQDPSADPMKDLEALAIAGVGMVAGLALTLSYKRWLLTGGFAVYTGLLAGLAYLIV